LAFGVQMETAVTRVGHGAVRQQHLKEATAIDGHVERLFGGLQAAGGELFLRAYDSHTGTQLQTRRKFAVLAGLSTGLTTDLIKQILKFGPILLEARCRDVRQVVGNGGQVHVLRGQTGLADPQCWKHVLLLVRRNSGAA